eukprot:GSMAST32.ASY1.ANO1.2251.1 assembled CDS
MWEKNETERVVVPLTDDEQVGLFQEFLRIPTISSITLPAILLNSHYDVVPAMENQWKYDPFGAIRTEEDGGRIYGRGTQDMKSVCVQYVRSS